MTADIIKAQSVGHSLPNRGRVDPVVELSDNQGVCEALRSDR